jgi:hypothetical protein
MGSLGDGGHPIVLLDRMVRKWSVGRIANDGRNSEIMVIAFRDHFSKNKSPIG